MIELKYKEEVYEIIGCALEVLNTIGHGFSEKSYENAMCVEFDIKKIPYHKQKEFPLNYKGRIISQFIPDLIAYENVIIELKVVDKITDEHRGQILNYLKITKCCIGVIINFKHDKLEWERVIL